MLELHRGCPRCGNRLVASHDARGPCHVCTTCQGRLVALEHLRRWAQLDLLRDLERALASDATARGPLCPRCCAPMSAFALSVPSGRLALDACRDCRLVWFDLDEIRRVRFSEREEGRRDSAVSEVEIDAELPPLQALLTVLRFPVEGEGETALPRPWLTWGIAAAIAALSGIAFLDLPRAVASFGFVPAEPWRGAGVTILTASFVHAGWLHLLGNLYFLLVFGDDVERQLGPARFVLLLLGATIFGAGLHALADPRATTPLIGASDAISGLIAFYALAFPHRRIYIAYLSWRSGQWQGWRFLGLAAQWWFVAWIAQQLLLAGLQVEGYGSVSALAHLGGVIAGVAAWWRWERTL